MSLKKKQWYVSQYICKYSCLVRDIDTIYHVQNFLYPTDTEVYHLMVLLELMRDLEIVFKNDFDLALQWLFTPNVRTPFNGKSPYEFICYRQINLLMVRLYVGALKQSRKN